MKDPADLGDSPTIGELIAAIDRLRESIEERVDDRYAYDLTTAAKKVGLSRRKLQELIEQGRLRCVRIDRRVLVTPEALQEMLATER